MSVNVTETVFNEQNLENISVSITKKNMITTSSTQYDKFFQPERDTLQSLLCQFVNTNCFRPETMPMSRPYFIPSHVTQLLEAMDILNEKSSIALRLNKTHIPYFRKAKGDFLKGNLLNRLWRQVISFHNIAS